jgi:tetrahydromethanopterin S-methyltransferase subunit G
MNPAILQQPFFQVALPIMVTLVATVWIAQWSQNKRFDDLNRRFDDFKSEMNRRFDEVIKRLDRIEHKLDDHEQRLTRVEERTSPLGRR